MFDFLRNLRKSEEEKRQEALSAYLDGALTPAEKTRFEQLLAADEALRASLEEQRLIKASLGRLPRMRAPRNFTLDPARYGRPAPGTAERLYPIMSVATAVVAILFVAALVLDLTPVGGNRGAAAPRDDLGQSEAEIAEAPVLESEDRQTAVGEVEVEVTRIVEAEEVVEMPAEEPAAAEMAVEEAPAEMAAEAEEAAQELAEEEGPPPDLEEASGGGAPPGETPMAMTAPVTADETAATAEGQALGERAVAGQPETQAATAEAAATVAARDMALTKEAASQPAPDAGPAAADQEPAPPESGAWLRTMQLLALSLGALLIILIAATLFVRRRAR